MTTGQGFNQRWEIIISTSKTRWKGESSAVLLEDVNLADALEKAFMELEPVYVGVVFLFRAARRRQPPAQPGSPRGAIEFCSLGSFWISLIAAFRP
jgi:hypothetical protein